MHTCIHARRQTERPICTHTGICLQADRQTDIQIDRQTDRQINRQIDRQTDR